MPSKLTYECASDYFKHRNSLFELHRKVNDNVSIDLYDSLYPGNPYGYPLLGLCFDGDQIVGQENYIQHNIASAGAVYRGALGINTMVDPEYRFFYGVFGKLCKLTIDEMRSRVDLLCAFANEESKKYYLKYFDWKIASKVRVYKKATKLSGVNRESVLSFFRPGRLRTDLLLKEVSEFEPAVLDPVIERYVEKSDQTYFYKTSEFLNWKFLNNKHYSVTGYYILYKDKVCGYCATYDHGIERKILDLFIDGNNIQLFEKTISCLSYLARKEGISRLVIYATPTCWYENALKRHFFIRRWDFDFITRAFDETIPASNWIIHIGDFDVF